jgi:hypothetical protein
MEGLVVYLKDVTGQSGANGCGIAFRVGFLCSN